MIHVRIRLLNKGRAMYFIPWHVIIRMYCAREGSIIMSSQCSYRKILHYCGLQRTRSTVFHAQYRQVRYCTVQHLPYVFAVLRNDHAPSLTVSAWLEDHVLSS